MSIPLVMSPQTLLPIYYHLYQGNGTKAASIAVGFPPEDTLYDVTIRDIRQGVAVHRKAVIYIEDEVWWT